MYANITVTLRHETGRTETIKHTRYARYDDESTILVGYILPQHGGTEVYEDEYDGLSWEIESVSHTEIPPDEQ
jgi:hypothetical protein